MTRPGKERAQEATVDSVNADNSPNLPPLGKRTGNFTEDTRSSKKKKGKRRQFNNTHSTTMATFSKGSKKGDIKAKGQQHETINISNDAMLVDNSLGTIQPTEAAYGEQNDATGDRTGLKSPLADIKDTHAADNLAVMNTVGIDDQREVNSGEHYSSGDQNDDSSGHHDDDDMDHLEDLDDSDDMHLDSGADGSDDDYFIGFADGFHDDGDNDDDEYNRYDEDEEYGMYDPYSSMRGGTFGQQFKAILENLRYNDDPAQQIKSLQNLAETLSISNEDTLAGFFPCDTFAQQLVKIMKCPTTGSTDNNNEDGMDGAVALNAQKDDENPELMVLACRCLSNLLDIFPSAAIRMVNFGIVGALCDNLKSIQYIDLAEQALEALKEIASQAPQAVLQNGGLGVAFLYFDFFNTHSQRTAIKLASHCMRYINASCYQQLVEMLPTLTKTLTSPDHAIVELTCLCWARLSDNYKSTPTELEKVLTTDILNTMVGLLPVPGNTNAIRSTAFNDILRVFQSVAKASPTLGYQLLHLDIVRSFYLVLTGAADIPATPSSLITLDSTRHQSLHTILSIIIDLLPPLPNGQEFDWDRFNNMEPIASRTRLRITQQLQEPAVSSSPGAAYASSSTAAKTPSVPDPRTELLRNNPQLLQRIGIIIFPLLLEIFSSTLNLAIRQLVTHTLVKLIFFMDGDSLKYALQDIPLSAFLADLLAHKEHSAFVIDALFQAEFLLKKLPAIYSTLFKREGVYHGAKVLANQKVVEDGATLNAKVSSVSSPGLTNRAPAHDMESVMKNTNNKYVRTDIMQRPSTYSIDNLATIASLTMPTKYAADAFSHEQHTRPDFNHALQQQQLWRWTSNSSNVGIGPGLLRRFIIQQAQHHMKAYSTALRSAQKHAVGSLQVLKQFASSLVGTPDDTIAHKTLVSLVAYINSSAVEISGFELLESGILEAFIGYLTLQQGDNGFVAPLAERRQAFHAVFIETLELDPDTGVLVSPAFRILVQRLETLLTRFERFKVELPLGSTMSLTSSSSSNGGGMVQNPVYWVTKQIRLRLHGQVPHASPGHQHLTVSTQATATFKTLEKYLLSSTRGKGVKSDNTANVDNKSAPPSCMGTKGFSIPISSGSLPEETKPQFASNTMLPPGTSASSSASASTSTTTAKSQKACNGTWKVQFYLNNELLSNDTSVYCAIHRSLTKSGEENGSPIVNYDIWTIAHLVTFKCIFTDDGADNNKVKKTANPTRQSADIHPPPLPPKQLADDKNDPCWKALELLKELATLSQPSHSNNGANKALVPMADFVNRKLTTKMQRQLEEPLIVASACLPDWATYCMTNHPFLFSFDVRYLYLQSTSFSVPRLVSNWQHIHRRNNTNAQDGQRHPFLDTGGRLGIDGDILQAQSDMGRIERKKVQARRDHILDDAIAFMALPGNSNSVLEIGYLDEEGTGLGPTLEFYALASKEFCKLSTHMWHQEEQAAHDDDGGDDQDKLYMASQQGLFPSPLSKHMNQKSQSDIVRHFKALGQFVAKSILDSRMIDIPFSAAFFKRLFHKSDNTLELIMDIDPVLGKSISHLHKYVDKKRKLENDTTMTPRKRDELVKTIKVNGVKIEDLCLDFTLPGKPDVHLKRNGSKIPVTVKSVEEYIHILGDMIVGSGVHEQISAFRDGFNGLLPIKGLEVLTCQELTCLFGTSTEDWSYSTLADAIKADHGFTMDSAAIKNLLEILSEMNTQEQRGFLQFTTGFPRLPIGGWKSMRPVFTIVKKNCDAPLGPDDYLPSVMTCANYLKMPDYTNKQIMYKQLLKSMQEGNNTFLLS